MRPNTTLGGRPAGLRGAERGLRRAEGPAAPGRAPPRAADGAPPSPGRHCHDALPLTVIDRHPLGIYTVILLLLLSFYVEMTVSPWARPGGARDARQLRPLPPRKRASRAGAAPSLPPRPGRTLVKGLEKWKPTHRAVGHPYETAPQGMPEGVSGERRCRSCWAQPAAVRGGDGAVACRGPIVSSTSSSTS